MIESDKFLIILRKRVGKPDSLA